MKRTILPVLVVLSVYILGRLNRLVGNMAAQQTQIEELQNQTMELRALLELQREALNKISERFDTAEGALFGEASERMARWNERLSDLDSLN